MSWSSKLRAMSSCVSSEGRSTGGVQVPGGVSMPSGSGGRSAIADAGEDPSSLLASVSLHQLPRALPLVNNCQLLPPGKMPVKTSASAAAAMSATRQRTITSCIQINCYCEDWTHGGDRRAGAQAFM